MEKTVNACYTYTNLDTAITDSENITCLYRENCVKIVDYRFLIGDGLFTIVYTLKIQE